MDKNIKKEGKTFFPTNKNYTKNSVTLQEIKQLNFWNFMSNIGAELDKKKSSKYGKLFKYNNYKFWVRFDYNTSNYIYTNLTTTGDNGTLIDFIQNHIINEKNLGKVKKYISQNYHLF